MEKKERKRIPKYKTLAEAKEAVKRLGITSLPKYERGYRGDPLLPSNPGIYYSEDWAGARDFFGKEVQT